MSRPMSGYRREPILSYGAERCSFVESEDLRKVPRALLYHSLDSSSNKFPLGILPLSFLQPSWDDPLEPLPPSETRFNPSPSVEPHRCLSTPIWTLLFPSDSSELPLQTSASPLQKALETFGVPERYTGESFNLYRLRNAVDVYEPHIVYEFLDLSVVQDIVKILMSIISFLKGSHRDSHKINGLFAAIQYSMRHPPVTVIYDLDGTLMNSIQVISPYVYDEVSPKEEFFITEEFLDVIHEETVLCNPKNICAEFITIDGLAVEEFVYERCDPLECVLNTFMERTGAFLEELPQTVENFFVFSFEAHGELIFKELESALATSTHFSNTYKAQIRFETILEDIDVPDDITLNHAHVANLSIKENEEVCEFVPSERFCSSCKAALSIHVIDKTEKLQIAINQWSCNEEFSENITSFAAFLYIDDLEDQATQEVYEIQWARPNLSSTLPKICVSKNHEDSTSEVVNLRKSVVPRLKFKRKFKCRSSDVDESEVVVEDKVLLRNLQSSLNESQRLLNRRRYSSLGGIVRRSGAEESAGHKRYSLYSDSWMKRF